MLRKCNSPLLLPPLRCVLPSAPTYPFFYPSTCLSIYLSILLGLPLSLSLSFSFFIYPSFSLSLSLSLSSCIRLFFVLSLSFSVSLPHSLPLHASLPPFRSLAFSLSLSLPPGYYLNHFLYCYVAAHQTCLRYWTDSLCTFLSKGQYPT